MADGWPRRGYIHARLMKDALIARFTGEQLLKAMKADESFRVDIKTQSYLYGNRAVLIEKDLFVSKEVEACLTDPDICEETMKELSIVILPKVNLNSFTNTDPDGSN